MEIKKSIKGLAKNKSLLITIIFLAAALILSIYFMEMRFYTNRQSRYAPISSFIESSANTPFQYRVLVPWIVKLIFKLNLSFIISPLKVFKTIEWVSVFLLFLAFRHYISIFFKNRITSSALALAMFYALPFSYIIIVDYAVWYPSDVPSVLFFTLGLIFLYKKNWPLYYIVFIAATFNRETACFLTIIYIFTSFGKNRTINIVFHCAAQTFIWLAIKYLLYRIYINNPGGGFFEVPIMQNLLFLSKPSTYPYILSIAGFTWLPVMLLYRYIPDDFVRRSTLVIIPFFLGMMYVGIIQELRIFGELIPVFLPAFFLIIRRLSSESCKEH